MERDNTELRISLQYDISTHTLTWSVTEKLYSGFATDTISTHTLTWSVTFEFFDNEMYIPKISTHTLTWSVTVEFFNCLLQIAISTHTLTWSVTYTTGASTAIVFNFNSHAHVERDP